MNAVAHMELLGTDPVIPVWSRSGSVAVLENLGALFS
jgi:hypothetical protein